MKYIYIVTAFLVGFIPVNASELKSDAVQAVRFDSDAMAQQLTNEFSSDQKEHVFYLANNGEGGDFKFKEQSSDRIIWISSLPKLEYEADGLGLKRVRFDSLDGANSVFHFLVEDQSYKLHLSQETAALRTSRTSPVEHINLIKAWLAEGKLIRNVLVVRSE
jgi:hypothetical protein